MSALFPFTWGGLIPTYTWALFRGHRAGGMQMSACTACVVHIAVVCCQVSVGTILIGEHTIHPVFRTYCTW